MTVAAVKSATSAFAEFDDKEADLMKTTRLSREEPLSWRNDLNSIDTSTSKNELQELARIAGKLVDIFVLESVYGVEDAMLNEGYMVEFAKSWER